MKIDLLKYVVLAAIVGMFAQPAMAGSDKREPGQGGVGAPSDGQAGPGVYVPTDDDKWAMYDPIHDVTAPSDNFHMYNPKGN